MSVQQTALENSWSAAATELSSNIYITGLSSSVTESRLRELCERCGKVVSVKIMLDAVTGASRGVGFALFETYQEALNAIEMLTGTDTGGGCSLRVELSTRQAKDILHRSTRVLVSNIPSHIEKQSVTNFFTNFGIITHCAARVDSCNRYMLTLTYSDEEGAARAVAEAHGMPIFEGSQHPLFVKFFETLDGRPKIKQPPRTPVAMPQPPPRTLPLFQRGEPTHLMPPMMIPPLPSMMPFAPVFVPMVIPQQQPQMVAPHFVYLFRQ